MQQRLKLRSKYHIDQDHRKGQSKHQAVHGLLALLFLAGNGNQIVGRQVNIFHCKAYFVRHLVKRIANIEIGRYLADAVLSTTEDFFRSLRTGDRCDLLQAEFFLTVSYDQSTEVVQGDIGNLDQDIPHLSPVLHLAGFEAAELLLQLFDNGRDADIMNAGNRAVDGDRYLRGAVFNGRLDIVKSRQTGDPSFYFFRDRRYFVQFLSFYLDHDGDSFASQKGAEGVLFLLRYLQ